MALFAVRLDQESVSCNKGSLSLKIGGREHFLKQFGRTFERILYTPVVRLIGFELLVPLSTSLLGNKTKNVSKREWFRMPLSKNCWIHFLRPLQKIPIILERTLREVIQTRIALVSSTCHRMEKKKS